MKIKMLVGLSGNEYSLAPGDEWEFPEAEALRLIDAEYAVEASERATTAASQAIEKRKKGKPDVVSTEGDDRPDGGTDIAGGSEAAT